MGPNPGRLNGSREGHSPPCVESEPWEGCKSVSDIVVAIVVAVVEPVAERWIARSLQKGTRTSCALVNDFEPKTVLISLARNKRCGQSTRPALNLKW